MQRAMWLLLPFFLGTTANWSQMPEWQPDKDGVWEMGYGPQPPRLVHAAEATVAPSDSGEMGGRNCYLSAVIGADGRASNVREVSNCPGPLSQAAVTAVGQSEFSPGSRDGTPVPVRVQLWIRFGSHSEPAVPRMFPTRFPRPDENNRPLRPLTSLVPEYSNEARKAKLQGTVAVTGIVTDEGVPLNVHVIRGLGKGLDEKAIECVNRARFEPALRDGNPVPSVLNVQMSFRLY